MFSSTQELNESGTIFRRISLILKIDKKMKKNLLRWLTLLFIIAVAFALKSLLLVYTDNNKNVTTENIIDRKAVKS